MGARVRILEVGRIFAGHPGTNCVARRRWKDSTSGGEGTAAGAESPSSGVREHDTCRGFERSVAVSADVERRRESELGNDAPCSTKRSLESALGWSGGNSVEAVLYRIEYSGRGLLVRKTKNDLGYHRRAREPSDVGSQLTSSAGNVELGERLQLTVGADVNLRYALGEEVHRATEPLARPAGAAREHRLNAGFARKEAKNS